MRQTHLLQPAYVLHRRPYRETSLLLEIFSQDQGRFSAIAKGVRKLASSQQSLLQAFIPLHLSWTGKNDLMVITHVELRNTKPVLQGENLFAGFYLNELLLYLLQKWDPHANIFACYETTLQALQSPHLEEKNIRRFEKYLLEALGYGVFPKSEGAIAQAFLPDHYYRFVPETGLIKTDDQDNAATLFSGKSLAAIAKEDWAEAETLEAAKRLLRFALNPLLGTHTINSRRLFLKP